MISLTEAQERVFAAISPNPVTTVDTGESSGLVLAADVASTIAIPPFASVAMDGFAVRSSDTIGASEGTPVILPVVGTVPAGQTAPRALEPGEAMRIMTGAPLPDGADAVVMVELTELVKAPGSAGAGSTSDVHEDERVACKAEVEVGNHIRPAGDDIKVADVAARAGSAVSPALIGLLTSVGVAEVPVYRRPVVGVLSTGDELINPGQPLQAGQIYDSNRPMLLEVVAQAGAQPVDLGHVGDDVDGVEEAFVNASDSCDAIVSSGGVSMGDFDPVKVVLNKLASMSWMQIAIKPAKPFSFGVLGEVPIFGLPGNPVSSAVSFELFARPALRMMMGDPRPHRRHVSAILDEPLRRRQDGKTHLVRVMASYQPDGALHIRSAGAQGSHNLTALAMANALAVVPDGTGFATGAHVNILLTGDSVLSAAASGF